MIVHLYFALSREGQGRALPLRFHSYIIPTSENSLPKIAKQKKSICPVSA
jgi:hypothetical protein